MTQALSFLRPKNTNLEAPLFVYLSGMDGTGQLLRTQMESLQQGFDVRCVAIPANNLQGWNTLATQVIDLIAAELKQRSHSSIYLCGESFGGCLAMKVAVRSPFAISGLILSNPASSFSQQPLFGVVAPTATSWVPEFLLRSSAIALLPFLAALGRIASRDRGDLLTAMQSLPPKTLSWRLSLLRDFQIEPEELCRFSPPVLLIAGARDRLLPSVAEAQRLARQFPNARIAILPDSGHACLLETDTQLCEILRAYDLIKENDPDANESQLRNNSELMIN
ncbi:alpha/beta hydrolase [Lusitaniella coriacea LEGE 07157]|uniref:Alpha/beta hydrolase n=1 Tax=Lusitaniella coriacea LEGE 07157 TaxID=945747 RepID=A0A8J7DUY0_9CYAN|nr:alpha/beta hydrolase [Lusitaniella coriacea]MBE9115070.1 alpha/beta hydrolase [Lusitaniella coriacea LEGE 07157]